MRLSCAILLSILVLFAFPITASAQQATNCPATASGENTSCEETARPEASRYATVQVDLRSANIDGAARIVALLRTNPYFSAKVPASQAAVDIDCGGTEVGGFCCFNGPDNCTCWNDGCVITEYFKSNECDCTSGGSYCECQREDLTAPLGLSSRSQ